MEIDLSKLQSICIILANVATAIYYFYCLLKK